MWCQTVAQSGRVALNLANSTRSTVTGRALVSGQLKNTTSSLTEARRGIFVIIQQGEEAQRLLLGRDPEKLSPGIRLALPFFHNVRRVDMRERRITANDLNGYSKDGVAVSLDGTLFFQVHNSHDALFEVNSYVESVGNVGIAAARAIVGNFDWEELTSHRTKINAALQSSIDNQIARWGVKCLRFEIQDVRPQDNNVKHQLALQMEAERKRRENELNTAAAVKTSEGLKISEILKSEGHRISAQNRAEADYITVTREADAQKYRIQAEASARAAEIDSIATNMNGDAYGAARFIVEMRRIKQLEAIASGPSNTVYVVPAEIVSAAAALGNVGAAMGAGAGRVFNAASA